MENVKNENFEFLTSNVLPRVGFAQVLDDQLLARIKDGHPMIELKAQGNFGNDKMEYELKLEKKEDRYYLNEIKATITKPGEESQSHSFRLYAQKGYNADEMYNMMDNRFVYREFMKEGEKVGRWSSIDLNKKNDNGNTVLKSYYDNTTNFNLVVQLGKIPLVSMPQNDKEILIRDMKMGNPGMASIRQPDGSKERVTLVAMPHIGTIALYNKEGQRIRLDENKLQAVKGQMTAVSTDGAAGKKLNATTGKLIDKVQEEGQRIGGGKKVKTG